MMSLHEARTRLAAMWPGRTVSVSAHAWYYGNIDGETATQYRGSILPGLCGKDVTAWEGSDFETVLLQAEAALRSQDSADQDCEVE